MAINVFKIKKYSALFLVAFLSIIFYKIGEIYYGVWGALGFFMCSLIIAIPVSKILLRNPFSDMLEWKGIIAFTLESTGLFRPFLVKVDHPYVRGKIGKREVTDVYDREASFSIAPPVKLKEGGKVTKDGGITLPSLDQEQMNQSRFLIFHFPMFLWNGITQTFITKDWLSNKEGEAFAMHHSLFLGRKAEDLSNNLRDFARYVVDQLKGKSSIFQNKWFVLFVVLFVLAIVGYFLWPYIQGFFSGAQESVGGVRGGGSFITPR